MASAPASQAARSAHDKRPRPTDSRAPVPHSKRARVHNTSHSATSAHGVSYFAPTSAIPRHSAPIALAPAEASPARAVPPPGAAGGIGWDIDSDPLHAASFQKALTQWKWEWHVFPEDGSRGLRITKPQQNTGEPRYDYIHNGDPIVFWESGRGSLHSSRVFRSPPVSKRSAEDDFVYHQRCDVPHALPHSECQKVLFYYLGNNVVIDLRYKDKCQKCNSSEGLGGTSLLCEKFGCDGMMHLSCSGLREEPKVWECPVHALPETVARSPAPKQPAPAAEVKHARAVASKHRQSATRKSKSKVRRSKKPLRGKFCSSPTTLSEGYTMVSFG